MTIFSGIVVFALIWWMAFFCLLPLNITVLEPSKDGSMPGAPVNPGIQRKAIIATLIACVLWVVAYFVITSDLISFRDAASHMRM